MSDQSLRETAYQPLPLPCPQTLLYSKSHPDRRKRLLKHELSLTSAGRSMLRCLPARFASLHNCVEPANVTPSKQNSGDSVELEVHEYLVSAAALIQQFPNKESYFWGLVWEVVRMGRALEASLEYPKIFSLQALKVDQSGNLKIANPYTDSEYMTDALETRLPLLIETPQLFNNKHFEQIKLDFQKTGHDRLYQYMRDFQLQSAFSVRDAFITLLHFCTGIENPQDGVRIKDRDLSPDTLLALEEFEALYSVEASSFIKPLVLLKPSLTNAKLFSQITIPKHVTAQRLDFVTPALIQTLWTNTTKGTQHPLPLPPRPSYQPQPQPSQPIPSHQPNQQQQHNHQQQPQNPHQHGSFMGRSSLHPSILTPGEEIAARPPRTHAEVSGLFADRSALGQTHLGRGHRASRRASPSRDDSPQRPGLVDKTAVDVRNSSFFSQHAGADPRLLNQSAWSENPFAGKSVVTIQP